MTAMRVRSFDSARMGIGLMRLAWGTCLVACLLFWFFILTALLG